jgi:hypothetical protein
MDGIEPANFLSGLCKGRKFVGDVLLESAAAQIIRNEQIDEGPLVRLLNERYRSAF